MSTGDTCTVACNLPNGLLLTHGKIRYNEDGTPKADVHGRVIMENPVQVRLYGGRHISAVGGYGLTHDVDAEWFEDYMNTVGKDTKLVQVKGLFSMPTADYAAGLARERSDLRSGLEPLEDLDPRGFEGNPNGSIAANVALKANDGTGNQFGRDNRQAV